MYYLPAVRGPLHKVAYTLTGESMLNFAHKMNDPGFLIRLNVVPNAADAVANDVQYHLKCWVNAQRSVANDSCDPIQEMNGIDSVLADIEIIMSSVTPFFIQKEIIL